MIPRQLFNSDAAFIGGISLPGRNEAAHLNLKVAFALLRTALQRSPQVSTSPPRQKQHSWAPPAFNMARAEAAFPWLTLLETRPPLWVVPLGRAHVWRSLSPKCQKGKAEQRFSSSLGQSSAWKSSQSGRLQLKPFPSVFSALGTHLLIHLMSWGGGEQTHSCHRISRAFLSWSYRFKTRDSRVTGWHTKGEREFLTQTLARWM